MEYCWKRSKYCHDCWICNYDIGCTLDEATQQYTVTFTFQDIHNMVMVDVATFAVLSSAQS